MQVFVHLVHVGSLQTSHEVDLDDAIHNFCSDACLEDFCRVNMGVCLSCGATCCKKPLRLKLIDATKVLCDTKCLEEFKEVTKQNGSFGSYFCSQKASASIFLQRTDIYYQCHKCQNYLPMSDMLHHRNNDYNVELFCNWDCLSSYKEKCIEEQGKGCKIIFFSMSVSPFSQSTSNSEDAA